MIRLLFGEVLQHLQHWKCDSICPNFQCVGVCPARTSSLVQTDVVQVEHSEEVFLVVEFSGAVHLLRGEACGEGRRGSLSFTLHR